MLVHGVELDGLAVSQRGYADQRHVVIVDDIVAAPIDQLFQPVREIGRAGLLRHKR